MYKGLIRKNSYYNVLSQTFPVNFKIKDINWGIRNNNFVCLKQLSKRVLKAVSAPTKLLPCDYIACANAGTIIHCRPHTKIYVVGKFLQNWKKLSVISQNWNVWNWGICCQVFYKIVDLENSKKEETYQPIKMSINNKGQRCKRQM